MNLKETIKKITEGYTLNYEEAKQSLIEFTNGSADNILISSFLTLFTVRKITPTELMGFRDAIFEQCYRVHLNGFDTIDLCGTGGDGKDTFNISTLTSFIVAGAGFKVTKHGNYGVSSSCGSSNILEALGLKFTNDTDKLKSDIEKNNICFLHAPMFHPAMKHVAPVRKSLGVKTFFNMLGPMLNPANPTHQVIGVFNKEVLSLYKEVYKLSDKNYYIIHSTDGYDEVSLTSDFIMISKREESVKSPEYFGFQNINPNAIYGGKTIEDSKKMFLNILQGKGTKEQNQVVIANAALAIKCLKPEYSIMDCVQIALDSMLGKQAYYTLKNAVENSN